MPRPFRLASSLNPNPRTALLTHVVIPKPVGNGRKHRNSFGGDPTLPADLDWPVCSCGERMVLFFQFDISERFGLPFRPGSHLTVFMCPLHNTALRYFPEVFPQLLPPEYWKLTGGVDEEFRFWQAILHLPGTEERVHAQEPHLRHQRLSFRRRQERITIPPGQKESDFEIKHLGLRRGSRLPARAPFAGVSLLANHILPVTRETFRVGGHPDWCQNPEIHRCSCGAPMTLVCQLPLDYPFPKAAGAPEQPDTFSSDDYCLFLGNAIYVFACAAQCSPLAVLPVVQN